MNEKELSYVVDRVINLDKFKITIAKNDEKLDHQ